MRGTISGILSRLWYPLLPFLVTKDSFWLIPHFCFCFLLFLFLMCFFFFFFLFSLFFCIFLSVFSFSVCLFLLFFYFTDIFLKFLLKFFLQERAGRKITYNHLFYRLVFYLPVRNGGSGRFLAPSRSCKSLRLTQGIKKSPLEGRLLCSQLLTLRTL